MFFSGVRSVSSLHHINVSCSSICLSPLTSCQEGGDESVEWSGEERT